MKIKFTTILTSLVIGICVSALYYGFRGTARYYWDDTSTLANAYLHKPSPTPSTLALLPPCFAGIQGDGYRPVSCWIRDLGRRMGLEEPDRYLKFFVGINAISQGVMAALLFLVGFSLGLPIVYSLLSTLLFVASTPNLTGALVISSGIQSLVPIWMCAGVLAFLAARRTGRAWPALVLGAILITGPFVREFLGVLPVILIFLEWSIYQRNRWWIISLALAALHALFPTALVKLLFYPELPFVFVARIGNLGAYVSSGRPKPRIFLDLFNLLPPSLLLAAVLFGIWQFYRNQKKIKNPYIKFLLFYFAASFLPFLKIFNGQVHLAYCLVPLCFLIGFFIWQAWILAGQSKSSWKFALLVLLAITFTDQIANVHSVRKVTKDMYDEIDRLGNWMKANIAPKDNVISQAHHLACVFVRSGFYFEPWTAPGDFFGRRKSLITADEIKGVMASQPGSFYLLNVDMVDTRAREPRILPLLHDRRVKTKSLGQIGQLTTRFPFFDPLRNFLPQIAWNWTGSPDLEYDFYRGPSMDGRWFKSEVSAVYTMHKVIGVD